MEKSVAERIFDSVHRHYDTFLRFATFKKIDRWQDEVVKNTPIGEFVVDIGTGTGEILRKIHQKDRQAHLIGVDLSVNMLKKTREKLKQAGINPTLIKADALNMPFKDCVFDNLFFSLVFRHLPSKDTILEIKRLLKTYGYVSIIEIAKPDNKLIYSMIYHFADKLFRPFGRLIFSKQEWDYFVESIKNSMTTAELTQFFKENGFKTVYYKKRFLGLVHIAVFQKED